jgi:tryptophan synthase alpha chain
MTSTILEAFKICKKEKRPALLTYTVAGDDTKKRSLEIIKSIAQDVDIIELGFPHNTPVADGSQIQQGSYRALKHGTKLKDVFKIIKEFKKSRYARPVILMGYFNLILQYGQLAFLKECKKVGVNGLIIVDLPFPENIPFSKQCKKNSVNFIQLISPTTTKQRMKAILKNAHDMVYYISMLSTTGGKLKVTPKVILKNYQIIKRLTKKNLVIGFGITTKTIKKFKKNTDGLVVGSEIVKEITTSLQKRQNPVTNITKLVKKLKEQIL